MPKSTCSQKLEKKLEKNIGAKLAIDTLNLKDKLGGLGPYVDYLLLGGALVAAFLGVQNQANVAAATADYETVPRAVLMTPGGPVG